MSLNRAFLKELDQRALPGGGYADRAQGQFRVDATAWGILAAEASGCDQDILEQHRSRLILE
jgi:hypothetical protein